MAENNLGSTQYFRTKPDQELEVKEILDLVYNAMEEKGYNPVNQIVGYIMSLSLIHIQMCIRDRCGEAGRKESAEEGYQMAADFRERS